MGAPAGSSLDTVDMSACGLQGLLHVADLCNACLAALQAVRGNVGEVLAEKDGRGAVKHLQQVLELEQVMDRDVEHLSGGARLTSSRGLKMGQNSTLIHTIEVDWARLRRRTAAQR